MEQKSLILGATPLTKKIATMTSAWIRHVDVTSFRDVAALIEEFEPEVVINATEISDLLLCERAPDIAISANALGAANVAMACRLYGAHLYHFSTDQVFGGPKGPYRDDQAPYPHNNYGVSKLLGENAVHDILPGRSSVLRFGPLYGAKDENCQPYIAMTEGGLRVNYGPESAWIDSHALTTPTYIGHVAKVIASRLVSMAPLDVWEWRPVVHVGPLENPVTWYDLLVNDFQVRPFKPTTPRRVFQTTEGLVPSFQWVTPGYREGLDAFIEEFRESKHPQAGTRA